MGKIQLLFICLKIFLCRVVDVTLATVRTVLTVKEKNLLAALIGFIEVTIWFLVVREALSVEGNTLLICVSYAGGFASGTFIGGLISKRFIRGNVNVQVITSSRDEKIVNEIRLAGFGASVVDVNGSEYGEEKFMILCEIRKNRLPELRTIISEHDPHAFVMVQETKYVYNGYMKPGK